MQKTEQCLKCIHNDACHFEKCQYTPTLEQRVQTLEASLKEQQVEISQLLKRLGV